MVGDALRRARQFAGLTQESAAERLGLTQSQLSARERGAHVPGLPILERMADLYGLTLDQLTGRAPLPAPEAPNGTPAA